MFNWYIFIWINFKVFSYHISGLPKSVSSHLRKRGHSMASLFFAHHCAYSTGLSIPLTCKSSMCVVFDARVCVFIQWHLLMCVLVCVSADHLNWCFLGQNQLRSGKLWSFWRRYLSFLSMGSIRSIACTVSIETNWNYLSRSIYFLTRSQNKGTTAKGDIAWHRGSIHASHKAVPSSILGIPNKISM